MPKLARLQGHDESCASGSTGREEIGVAGLAELGPDPAKKYCVSPTVGVTVGTIEYNNLQQLLYCTFITSPSLRVTHHIHCFKMPGLDIEPAVIDDTRS
jgi:hypothetical protein